MKTFVFGYGFTKVEDKYLAGYHGYMHEGEVPGSPVRADTGYLVSDKGYVKAREYKANPQGYTLVTPLSYHEGMIVLEGKMSEESVAIWGIIDLLTRLPTADNYVIHTDSAYVAEVLETLDRIEAKGYVGERGVYPHRTALKTLYALWVEEGRENNFTVFLDCTAEAIKALTEAITGYPDAYMSNRAYVLAKLAHGHGESVLSGPKELRSSSIVEPPSVYWSADVQKEPLVCFSDILTIPCKENTDKNNTVYTANVKKSLTEIGSRVPTVAYSSYQDRYPLPLVDEIRDIVAVDVPGNYPISIKVKALYNKAFVRDFERWGRLSMRRSGHANWVIAATGKPLVIGGNPANMMLLGMDKLDRLDHLMHGLIMPTVDIDEWIDVTRKDITDSIYKDGKITDLIKEATGTVKLPHPRNKGTKVYLFNNNLPDKSAFTKLAKQKVTVELISYREEENAPYLYAVLVRYQDKVAIYQNSQTSYLF